MPESYNYKVVSGQNLPDIALQEYGSVEGILNILEWNTALSASDDAPATLKLPDIKNPIRDFLRVKKIIINTGKDKGNGNPNPGIKTTDYKDEHYNPEHYK